MPADGINREIGSMSAALSKERSHDGASQIGSKDIPMPGSKERKKKKTHSAQVTLPPLCREPPSLSAFVAKPFSLSTILRNAPLDRPLSVVELPRLIAQVGPGRAIADMKWTEGPRLMASALGTDIPVKTADQLTAPSLMGKDESIKVTTCNDKKITTVKNRNRTKPNKTPLTGAEVVYILANKRDLGEPGIYYLKEVDGDSYRPYDLRVVHPSKTGSEHYIFSPNSVLRVTEKGYGELVSLAEWYRESVLWTALREIPFFRNFRLQKAFSWWRRNVRKVVFQRRCEDLQNVLLLTVPQYRNALLLFTRIIEELKGTHLLPHEEPKTYTVLEFKDAVTATNQECLQILEKLSQYHAVILNAVKQGSYKSHDKLQQHIEDAKKPNKSYKPIHLHLAHQRELRRELARSESILAKLGNFAALVNQMIVQSLVTVIRQDVSSFLNNVLKRQKSHCCLFHTALQFSACSQLTVDPPVHLFQQAVSGALLTAGDSIIRMCDTCGFFLEVRNSVFSSGTSDFSCIEHLSIAEVINYKEGVTGCMKFCCRQLLRDLSLPSLPQPNRTVLKVQGNSVHGSYYPLPKRQLEWQISITDVTKQVEKEQSKIMQEAELEIQQLCESYSWLMDIHLFISQWSQVSLESMIGQPALLYEEHIQRIRQWTAQINTVPSSFSTSNQLFIIQCTPMKENLGQQLRFIEEEVLEQLVEQIKLRSETVISDLETATAELQMEPQDLTDVSKYAVTVRESVKLLADTQKHLECIHSLQDTVYINNRKMAEQEVTLDEKMLDMWDCFISLVKQGESIVCHHLPSMANALDRMFSFLVDDLKNVTSKSMSGLFLDPTQNAKEMVSTLNHMYTHVHCLSAKLEELSRNSQNLREHPMDLAILATDVQKVKARKELWELIAAYPTWMDQWKQLLFSEVVVSQAQEKIAKWKEQALSLTCIIPTDDAVLQETLGILESLSCQLALMAKLQSPTLKHSHWKAVFEGMGLLNVSEKNVTVAELMSGQLEVDQKLITKICRDAQAECDMEQSFQKLRQGWEGRLFRVDIFSLPDWRHCEPQHGFTERPAEGTVSQLQTASQHSCGARFIISGLEMYFAEIENDLMTLSTMLKSPCSVEFRLQIEDWMQLLQELGKLLSLFERYQTMWIFLTKMFHESPNVTKVDLLGRFQQVDVTFKDIMNPISIDPHVLNLIHFQKTTDSFHSNSLCQVLTDGLSAMECISNKMMDLLDTVCDQFPRLWFLSHREVIQLLSVYPVTYKLQPFIRKFFKGVCFLKMDCEIPSNTGHVQSHGAECQVHRQMKVLGVFGSLQEDITFLSPLEPNDVLLWLCNFEKQLKLTMGQLIKQCAVARNQLEPSNQDFAHDRRDEYFLSDIADWDEIALPVKDLLSAYPLQCLLVAEEAVWCKAVLQAFQEMNPMKLSDLEARNSAKLKNLGSSIRVLGAKNESHISKYTLMCLSAVVQLTINHAQQLSRLMKVQSVPLESSFEWLSVMKYYIKAEDWGQTGNDDPTCYVDVFDQRLQYDYEYFGPADWVMAHTASTDRASLGILLALTSYRCGFVSGTCMSGKEKTVVHLGKALGRQIVIVQCFPSMRPCVVQRMLLGALQTGAWLLLDSVDLLPQGLMSSLGQHLVDIHQSFSGLTGNKNQRMNDESKNNTADGLTGCKKNAELEVHVVLAGKSISASLSYGCVLMSVKGYTEVPESLRRATRPIVLTRPDYRIIAEVMLTSIGFSEAMSLSRKLVCLISLAKDSRCLPDFITNGQSCCLVILQKIVSASEIYLQREISDEAKRWAAGQTNEKPPRRPSSTLSVIQGLMEETAIVKAIISVLLPVIYENKKASQFNAVFKDMFHIACQDPLFQLYIEEEEKNQLEDAVGKELQKKRFHCDTEIICKALTLYHTLKFSQAVMLIGPSGSGKTTCYCALVGALNHLAAMAVGYDNVSEGNSPQTEPQISSSTWNSVNAVVLFPNAMSHEELFGCFCEKRGWQDGAVANVLRDSERCGPTSSIICNKKTNLLPIVKWLVMDGKPMGQPGWLDYLTTLCNPEEPFLCLSSGETLPSQSHLKLLMEITDLGDASPSVVTRCSLVYFTGTDLWKAVWKSEVETLSSEHKLDQGILKMWNRLSEDLFSSTLNLLKQKALTSAIHNEGESFKSLNYGLQEVMSCGRILRALLQYFGHEVKKADAIPQIDKRDIPLHRNGTESTDSPKKQELLTRNLFLIAYIWGFGGHLHPHHWPQFDLLVRQVLSTCRYKIVVPDEENIFDHFFNSNSKVFPYKTLSISHKHGKSIRLLELMLKAQQPVLVVGEPGSGKTDLCTRLLEFDRPHINLPASPLLSSRHLRTILISCQKSRKDTMGSTAKQLRLLLFVDDIHEAPCDVHGKISTALETLRQSISKGGILTFDTYHLKLLSSRAISYMATCCFFGSGNHHNNVISSRLSRLFSIFVLPCLSMDTILGIHSAQLRHWLKDLPLMSVADMACCIITATKSLYDAVCDQFQPTVQRPHFIFSRHDIEKVLRGMCLWQPATVLGIVPLWMHECMRTFNDRLCSEDESKTLVSLIAKTATAHYGIQLADEIKPGSVNDPTMDTADACGPVGQILGVLNMTQESKPADQPDLEESCALSEPSLLSENNGLEDDSQKTHFLPFQLFQHLESVMPQLAYGPDLSEALKSNNQKSNLRRNFSYQDQDLNMLQQKLCVLIDRKERGEEAGNDHNITARCILHRQRVSQLLHILRVLLIPAGHGVLISSDRGTGRKTTVRLAAYVMGYKLMEVHSDNENKLHDILKDADNETREDGVSVIILVHEGISQPVREQILVAMAHNTYPGVCTDEELGSLVSTAVTAVKCSRQYRFDIWRFKKSLRHIHKNVHVFLLFPFTMSDSGESHANNTTHAWNAQLTKAMALSCCVEVYQPWSKGSLVEVAAQCLRSSRCKMERETLEVNLSVAMAGIHRSACQYASVLLRAQIFSPQTYMEFIAHFGYLHKHLHTKLQQQASRVAAVLSHLDVMNNTAAQHKQHLRKLQEKVAETQQREKELLRAVDYQRSLLEEAQEMCAVEENKLYYLEEQMKYIQAQVKSVFLSCLKILNCLNPSDLEEVRHYRDPPDGVVKVMDAICLLFNCPPGWESAKQLLGQSNFFQELEFFDPYTLTNNQLQHLGQIVHSPQFVPESVREVSKACESLCRWVQAVYECCCMLNQLLAKQQLEMLAKEARGQLHQAKQNKEDAHCHLEDVTLQLQLVQNELMKQLLGLDAAEGVAREAAAAVKQLETNVRDWRAAAQEAEMNYQTLTGDALILAAVISYLGPFGPDMRTELLSKWRELCQTGSIDINPTDPRTSLFTHSDAAPSQPLPSFPIPVSEKLPLGQALGIRVDTTPARMVVKLLLWGCRSSWVQRWPLLTDTQQHLDISFLAGGNDRLQKEVDCGMMLCADDPQLLDKLDQAAEKGLRVLVTHLERTIVNPRFLARLTRPAGCCLPGLEQHVQPTHPEFCLFLSTHLPVQLLSSAIHPSILAQVGVVDLSLSSEEIQELMLTQLLQGECKKLLIQDLQFQNDTQLLQDKLVSEEDALMDHILRSNTSRLLQSSFLPRVAVCQEAMEKLQTEIQQLSEELRYHESLLTVPRQLTRLAAALYQALQQVSRLSPAYYFSLCGFITVMHEAFAVNGRLSVPFSPGKRAGGIVPELTNRMASQLLVQYRPCLTKSHAAVLKLLVSVALLQHNRFCSEAEGVAFLRGLQDTEHPVTEVSQSTSALPSWIPSHIHPELLCLDKVPVFRGLIASLCTYPKQWQEYLHFPSSSVVGAVPCCSHSHLSLLQRALLWKTMLPDCLEELADAMAVFHPCFPCQIENEIPHTGNPEALWRYLVKHEGPIILTLPSPGGDEWTSIQPLSLINKLAHSVTATKEVQVEVISFGALYDREVLLSKVDKAVNDGHWLVFNNCQLLEQWDAKVVAYLSQLISSFRAAVRMCALPLVCDSPWDLKEGLRCALREAMSFIKGRSVYGTTADNTELLLRCAVFHSVLLQRQTYKYFGQGTIYDWTQQDLLALMDAHISIASLCHDKAKALQYIAVNMVHGSHVRDSADLEVVESVAMACLSRAAPLRGSGPRILSNTICNPGHSELAGLRQILEQRLQDSANINDPLALGFSAAVAAEIVKVNSQNLNTILQASQTAQGTARSLCTQPKQPCTLLTYSHARDRLQSLRSYLAHRNDSTDTRAGAVSHSPLRDFLQAEWDDLTDSVSLLLSQLQKQHSTATFTSLLKLTDLSRLERRAQLLGSYLGHNSTSDPPGAYRLSAFRNARGFLVAVMRQAAHTRFLSTSDIALQFQVLGETTNRAPPSSDACLCGLELRGASWDLQLGAIQDAVSLQPCPLPLVCVKAHVRSSDTFPCESSHLKDDSSARAAPASPSAAPQLPLYLCPLYQGGEQESGTWEPKDDNIITTLPLPTKQSPALCSLRRVRLVSLL